MSQQPDGTSPALLLAADVVEVMENHPEWQTRATFITDRDSSYLYLWRLTIEPSDSNVLPKAITARVLQDVRLSGLQEMAEAFLAARGDVQPAQPPTTGAKPGRKVDTWSDEHLAMLARDYVHACRYGDPYERLRDRWPQQTIGSLRTAVKHARERKLLTETEPGVAGGELTLAAKVLLRGQTSQIAAASVRATNP